MNPTLNYWTIVADRIDSLQAEADAAGRARWLRRRRRALATAAAGPARRRYADTIRGIMMKLVEEL
jgi:hypothetical protein